MSIAKELEVVADALKSDPELFYAYQSNIAMPFVDSYCEKKNKKGSNCLTLKELKEVANEAAVNFLNLLIKETEKSL
jgi:hypothetical protein